jgi:hypothetical protein
MYELELKKLKNYFFLQIFENSIFHYLIKSVKKYMIKFITQLKF